MGRKKTAKMSEKKITAAELLKDIEEPSMVFGLLDGMPDIPLRLPPKKIAERLETLVHHADQAFNAAVLIIADTYRSRIELSRWRKLKHHLEAALAIVIQNPYILKGWPTTTDPVFWRFKGDSALYLTLRIAEEVWAIIEENASSVMRCELPTSAHVAPVAQTFRALQKELPPQIEWPLWRSRTESQSLCDKLWQECDQQVERLKAAAADLAKLTPSQYCAVSIYKWAVEENPKLKKATDREVYNWIKEHGLPDQLEADGYRLPKFEAFARYVREGRRLEGKQKKVRSEIRPSSRSAIKLDKIHCTEARQLMSSLDEAD